MGAKDESEDIMCHQLVAFNILVCFNTFEFLTIRKV